MSFGTILKSVGVTAFILAGVLQWTEGKSRDFYRPSDSPLRIRGSRSNATYRTHEQIDTLMSKLNSTLKGIPNQLNSTLNSIPTKVNSTLNGAISKINSAVAGIFSIINLFTSSLGDLAGFFEKPPNAEGGGGFLSPDKLNGTLNAGGGLLSGIFDKGTEAGGGFLSSIKDKFNGTLNFGGDLLSGIFNKGGEGGGGFLSNITDKFNGTLSSGLELISIFLDKEVEGGNPCNKPDVLLLANLPGIFIGVPLVILGISILVGAIAAIVIAIGGLGEHITDHIYEETDFENLNSGHMDATSFNGHGPLQSEPDSPSISSHDNYGSGSNSNPWLHAAVDSMNKDFNQAYDKYSAMSQPEQLSQSQNNGYFEQSDPNYQHWSSNHVARRKQR